MTRPAPPRRVDAIIKLGGSVVTDKARACTPRPAVIRAIGEAITAAVANGDARVILVHGTGSYGKPFANRYAYLEGHFAAERVGQFLEIRNALADLGRIVARELAATGLHVAELDAYHAFSLIASTTATDVEEDQAAREAGRPEGPRGGRATDAPPVSADAAATVAYDAPHHVELLLDRGATPLFRGDLYVCARDGYRVVSSDEMVARLARHYRPRAVLFLSDVEGVFRPGTREALPTLSESEAAAFDEAGRAESDALDVSGGMRAKVKWAFEAAHWTGACWIADGFAPEAWRSALAGAPDAVQGTRVVTG